MISGIRKLLLNEILFMNNSQKQDILVHGS